MNEASRHLAHSAPDCFARTPGACRGIPWSASIVSEGGSVHVGLSRLEDFLEQGFGSPPIRWHARADSVAVEALASTGSV